MFARALVSTDGMFRPARNGDGLCAYLAPITQATDSNQVISAQSLSNGLYIRSGMTAARTDTTDTAVNILAQFPNMDVGDTMLAIISVTVAFALNLAAGAGVTLGAKTSIPASSFGMLLITKTSATTVRIDVL